MTDLGCSAEWSWQVRSRTGERVADPSSTGWLLEASQGGRRLDATGELTLTVQVDCCNEVDSIETGDELYLYRAGELVWFGPITKAVRQSPDGEAVIDAADRSWWLKARFPAFPLDWNGRDAGLNVRDVLNANAAVDPLTALAWADPPPGFLLGVQLSMEPRTTTAFSDILETLAEAVIDWTVLGSDMIIGTEGTPTANLPTLTVDSWDDGRFTNVQDHNDYATQVIVGGKDDLVGYWPPFTATPPFRPPPNVRWGARDVYIADSTLSDVAACVTRARVEYGQRNPPPRRASVPDGGLVDQRITFNQLIPGAQAIVAGPTSCGGTTLVEMLLATVSWTVVAGVEQEVRAAFVEKGSESATA